MKRNIILLLTSVAIVLTSCSTMKKSTSTTLNVESGIYQYPTVADLEVKEKVETKITWNYVPFNIGQPPLDLRKNNLIADIIKENNADVLLEPQITFTKRPFSRRSLTITGFPATFKNFRKADKEDLKALEVVIPAHKAKVYNVAQPLHKKIFHFRKNK